jgi:hypothetical protein
MPIAGNVQQALATALTNPKRKANGKATGPELESWSKVVIVFSIFGRSYLQEVEPAAQHPPALDAFTYAWTSFVSVSSPETMLIPRPLTIASTPGTAFCAATIS